MFALSIMTAIVIRITDISTLSVAASWLVAENQALAHTAQETQTHALFPTLKTVPQLRKQTNRYEGSEPAYDVTRMLGQSLQNHVYIDTSTGPCFSLVCLPQECCRTNVIHWRTEAG